MSERSERTNVTVRATFGGHISEAGAPVSVDREQAVIAAFVGIARSLTEGYDVVELHSILTADCVRLLDIASAGLMLADRDGVLHLMAASSERMHDIETFQLQRHEGPCLDCYQDGSPVLVYDLSQEQQRWPQFVPAALAAGFTSVHALPMRLQDSVLGTLGLFGTQPGRLTQEDLHLGQALADVASLALVAEKNSADKDVINAQLQTALQSRVVLEQAKGLLPPSPVTWTWSRPSRCCVATPEITTRNSATSPRRRSSGLCRLGCSWTTPRAKASARRSRPRALSQRRMADPRSSTVPGPWKIAPGERAAATPIRKNARIAGRT